MSAWFFGAGDSSVTRYDNTGNLVLGLAKSSSQLHSSQLGLSNSHQRGFGTLRSEHGRALGGMDCLNEVSMHLFHHTSSMSARAGVLRSAEHS